MKKHEFNLIDALLISSLAILVIILFLIFIFLVAQIGYSAYIVPKVDAKAHNYCISEGYDTFESWKGVGFFPKDYEYVKCKFVENRKDIQGNLELR